MVHGLQDAGQHHRHTHLPGLSLDLLDQLPQHALTVIDILVFMYEYCTKAQLLFMRTTTVQWCRMCELRPFRQVPGPTQLRFKHFVASKEQLGGWEQSRHHAHRKGTSLWYCCSSSS